MTFYFVPVDRKLTPTCCCVTDNTEPINAFHVVTICVIVEIVAEWCELSLNAHEVIHHEKRPSTALVVSIKASQLKYTSLLCVVVHYNLITMSL